MEVIVVRGVLDAEVGVVEAGVAPVEGLSVEGVPAVDGAALEGESVVEGAAEGESVVDGAAALDGAALLWGSARVVLASAGGAFDPLLFCLFRKSPNASSFGGTREYRQCSQMVLEVAVAPVSEQPPLTKHCSKLPSASPSTKAEPHSATTLGSQRP